MVLFLFDNHMGFMSLKLFINGYILPGSELTILVI